MNRFHRATLAVWVIDILFCAGTIAEVNYLFHSAVGDVLIVAIGIFIGIVFGALGALITIFLAVIRNG